MGHDLAQCFLSFQEIDKVLLIFVNVTQIVCHCDQVTKKSVFILGGRIQIPLLVYIIYMSFIMKFYT